MIQVTHWCFFDIVVSVTNHATLIELDSRKRAPLRQIARHERYLATVEPDGVVILTPAVVMTEYEARFRAADPEAYEKLVESHAHPERLVRRPDALHAAPVVDEP